MLAMILQLTHTTPQCHVYQGGMIIMHALGWSITLTNILYSTHKVVGVSTLSRLDHSSAQTREVECTRQVLPQVIGRG